MIFEEYYEEEIPRTKQIYRVKELEDFFYNIF